MAGMTYKVIKKVKNSKYYNAESAILFNLSHRFENEITVDRPELYDSRVFQVLLAVLTNRNIDTICKYYATQIKYIEFLKIFENKSVKNLILSGDIVKGTVKFGEGIDKKYSSLWFETVELYFKTLFILYSYFDFYNNLSDDDALDMSEKIFIFSFSIVLGTHIIRKYKDMNKEEQDACNKEFKPKKDQSFEDAFKKSILLPEHLCYNCDESIKEDFVKLYNAVRKHWEVTLFDGNEEKRNRFENFDDLELQNDWTLFKKVLRRDFFEKPKANKMFNRDDIFKIKNADLLAEFNITPDNPCYSQYNLLKNYMSTQYTTMREVFVRVMYNYLIESALQEKFKSEDSLKSDLSKEIKELKATNKNLTKSISKLNSENEALEKEKEANKTLLEEFKQSEQESQELLELREKVQELTQKNNDLTVSYTKLENRVNHSESKVETLEAELKYFDGVEQTLMVLQNENNAILSDISKIESLENAEDGDAEFERKWNAIKDEPILFIGGTGDMLTKYLELFPNSENINISDNNPNFTISSRFKYVAIYTKVVKHSFCERAASFVDKENIIYLNILNKKFIVDELYKRIVGHKN